MKPQTTCLLLLNGNHARFVFNSGPGKGLDVHKESDMEGASLHPRDIQADKPGRAFDSKGQGRHAMEYPSDPTHGPRVEFLENVVTRLKTEHKSQAFDRLVVIAPARVLNDFLPLLPKDLETLVYRTMQKDLTKVPVADLPQHVESVIAP